MTTMLNREVALDVRLIHWTGTLFPAYAAARVCYSKAGYAGIKPLESERAMGEWLRDHVLARGHWSIIEQLDFNFIIRGISRACSHQLVRHRLASYAQQSQRYVDKADFRYVVPESIRECPEAYALYQDTMRDLGERYEQLQELMRAAHPDFSKESVNQDARFILPNACETEIVMKINARQVLEMSRKRLCSRAQWEIRAMFEKIREILQAEVPVIFDNLGADCAWGKCREGGCPQTYKTTPGW
ncbi:MAG TPA: FAD-dependent thymidylate synthase [Armatimonadota bacterium]|nr:FAD-dependent thymidylate synthase [Armatimonadota bacterium]